MPKFSSIINLSIVFVIFSIITCSAPPTSPYKDPKNITISIFSKNNAVIIQNDTVSIGVAVNIPSLVKSLRVLHGDDLNESFLILNNPSSDSPDTIYFKTLYKTTGNKTITVKAILSDNSNSDYPFEIKVLSPEMKIVFDTIPPQDTTVFAGSTTTMRIVSHTIPATTIQYTVKATPSTDSNSTLSVSGINNASIVFKPSKTGSYILSTAAYNETIKDSIKSKVNVISAPLITVSSPHTSSQIGSNDTVIFTGAITDSLVLVNGSTFKTGEVIVLKSGSKNTLSILFTPQDVKTYSFSILVNEISSDNKGYSGVVTVVRDVTGSTTTIWKQDTLSITATEGSVITKSFESYLNNVSLTDVIFTASKGIIIEKVWHDTIPWGSNAQDTVILSAKYNGTVYKFKIGINITPADLAGPSIVLKEPISDSAKVSSKSLSIEVTCTDPSGVASVTCEMGSTEIPVTKGIGDIFTAAVTNLVSGANTLTFTGTDRAPTPNVSTKIVTIIYNPSISDNVPPTVVIKNPSNADQRVQTDTITVQIECTDDNGISSAVASRAGVNQAVTNAGAVYSVKLSALTAGKSDTLKFTVTDNSPNKVTKDFSVVLRYNRKPSAITLTAPEEEAIGVARKTAFTWSGGDDPDGDPVVYTLMYGTSEMALTKLVTGIPTKTTTLTTSLAASTQYFWKVIAQTVAFGDSIASEVGLFTTVEEAPVISVDPVNQLTVVGTKATFSVTATGLNLKYQWQKGTSTIIGATSATYITSAVTASDDASSYNCVVTNGGGSKTSASATLKVLYGITYNVNTGTGTVPIDTNHYAKDDIITIKSGTGLSLTGLMFGGWSTAQNSSGLQIYSENDTLKIASANVVLYAVWTALPSYYITYNGNGNTSGSVPAAMNYQQGTQATVESNSGVLAKSAYAFSRWNTAADGSGTDYLPGQKIVIGSTNITLYANWTLIPTYSVTYNSNGALAGTVPVDSKTYFQSDLVTSSLNSGNLARLGYVFAGWNTNADGTGIDYIPGVSTFQMSAINVTLFAKWVIKDASGNIYTEVKIGSQIWMVQNFRTQKYNDGTGIIEWNVVYDDSSGRYYYGGDSLNGAYYDGFAVNTGRLAPAGWRVANSSDWDTLIATVNDAARTIAAKVGWNISYNESAIGYDRLTNNSTGFSAVPAGYYQTGGVKSAGDEIRFWLADKFGKEEGTMVGDYTYLYSDDVHIDYDGDKSMKTYGLSVRCVRTY
jgi:uncharacterized protein (TIGR02145 family)/uncharacterized repeat protein (TIGR02543 family)